jgi:cytochrome c oxidase assembly protein subunit 15
MLKDEIGIFHACLAQAYLGLLVVIGVATSPFWIRLSSTSILTKSARLLAGMSITTSFIIYGQLALGATMRHEHRDLSILDFPLAYGKIIPDITAEKLVAINAWRDANALSNVTASQIWLQMAHRLVALLIAVGVIAFWFRVRQHARECVALKHLSNWWVSLVACQILLGAWTIWSNKAADIATAHVAVGAMIFGLGIAVAAICLRLAGERVPVHRGYQSLVREEATSS